MPVSTGAAWRVVPFAILVGFVALEPLLRDWPLAAGLDLRWVTVARGGVVALGLAIAWPHLTELRGRQPFDPADSSRVPGASEALHVLLGVAAGLLVFVLWIALDHGWAVTHHGEAAAGFVPLGADGRLDWPLSVLRLAGFAIVVPIAEELFWRSFLLRWIDRRRFLELDPRRASVKAFAICSVLFALEHSQWLAGLAAGMIYTGVYTRTGNLRVPIVAHAITNATLGIWILATGHWSLW